MGMSHDVRLPKSVTPTYPDRCVVCQEPGPDACVSVWTHSIGWSTVLFWHFGRPFRAKVPACSGCASKFRRQRWLRLAMNLVMIGIAVAIVIYALGEYKGPLRKWLWMGATLLVLAPFMVWEALHAPAVDLTAFADEVDYEFADRSYELEFARLNNGRVD